MLVPTHTSLRFLAVVTLSVLVGAGCGSSNSSKDKAKTKAVSAKEKMALCMKDRAHLYAPLEGQSSADRAKQDCDALAQQNLLDDKGQKKSS